MTKMRDLVIFLPCGSMLDFEFMYLSTQDVELDLEFFRWVNIDSNAYWNDEVGGGCKDRIEFSELGRVSSVSEGKKYETDGNLSSEVEGAGR